MSTMVFDQATQQEKITLLLSDFQAKSAKGSHAKVDKQLEEKRINKLLDTINEYKDYLCTTNRDFSPLILKTREIANAITVEPNEQTLNSLRALIDSMNTMAAKMVRFYADLNRFFQQKNVDRAELKLYKEMADDLKETAIDLENRFFIFPADEELQDLMRQFAE